MTNFQDLDVYIGTKIIFIIITLEQSGYFDLKLNNYHAKIQNIKV